MKPAAIAAAVFSIGGMWLYPYAEPIGIFLIVSGCFFAHGGRYQ